jgi:O-antigen/teichoic acid export membrane protein
VLAGPAFSRYALVTAALATAQTFFALGAPRTASYFEGRVAPGALAGWLTAAALGPTILVFSVLGLARPVRLLFFPSLSPGLLWLGLAPLPFLLLGDSLMAILIARGRERLYGPVVWARSLAGGVILAASLTMHDRLVWVLTGRLAIAATVAVALATLTGVRPTLRGVRAFAPGAAAFAVPVAEASALASLHRRADVFLLSALGRASEIGAYAVAYSVAEALWILTDSLEASLFVDLSRLETNAARARARRALVACAGIGLLATLGLAAGRLLLGAAFGRDYPAAPTLFAWVLVAAILWGTSRPLASYLYSRRLGSRVAAANGIGLAVNIVLCLAWIPRAGALGAARATLASYAVQLAVLAVLAGRRTAPPDAAGEES